MASDRTAVVIPGRMYGPHAPLLFYAASAAQARGAKARSLHWTPPSDVDSTRAGEWVRGQVAPVLDEVTATGAPPLVIAKSLGTYAATLAAERDLPAVWLTPLLREPEVVD